MRTTQRRSPLAYSAMVAVLALVAGLVMIGGQAATAPASAETKYGTAMVRTQKMAGPHLTKYTQIGWYNKGQRLALNCYVRGQYVRGWGGGPSNLWYKVSDGRYVADIDLNTGSNNPITGACKSTAPYRLPFKKGTRYRITQGPAEHARGLYPAYNRHAVDFALPSGTPVLASRSGRIYFEGWDNTRAIQVRIDHGSDNCTQYVHLSRSIVNRGQSVSRGQVIGYSGMTGISSGPHLHWNRVYCGSTKSRGIVNTLEMGTRYPVGMSAYSKNG